MVMGRESEQCNVELTDILGTKKNIERKINELQTNIKRTNMTDLYTGIHG
jgi:predicted RNA-binding protein